MTITPVQLEYTSSELTQNFPVDTTAHLQKTINLIDDLIQQGVLSDRELRQLLPIVGTALDAHIEQAAPASAAYSGIAGTVNREYYAVPVYPLIPGSAANPRGRYLNQLTEQPGGGRMMSKHVITENDMQRGWKGGSSAVPPTGVAANSTAAELDQSNFVTVVAPVASASKVAGAKWDIYATATEQGAAAASGTVVLETPNGQPADGATLTVDINGTAITVTLTGTATAANLVAEAVTAINNDSAVNSLIVASAGTQGGTSAPEVVITARQGGTAGNAITLSASATPTTGTGEISLQVSGATLSGGTAGTNNASLPNGPYLVASNVASGATVIDSNQVFRAYKLPAHTEFGVDTTTNPATFITGPRTVIPTN